MSLLLGQVTKLALQAAYFVVLARMLGATGYGAFAAGIALAALASPFSSLGTNTLMIKNVSRDEASASTEWQRALIYTVCGGFFFSVLLWLIASLIAPEALSRAALLQLAVADLVGLRVIDLVGSVWQALGKSRALAVLPSLTNLMRLIAAAAIWLYFGQATLDDWATVYLWVTLPLGAFVATHTTIKLGARRSNLKITFGEITEGLMYSVALAAQNVYNDIDKAMLARMISAASSGVYSAAYRIIDMAYAPIRSVSAATYPLYFQHGEQGLRSALTLTRKISPMVIGYAVLGSIAVAASAPLAPAILGNEYIETIGLIQWMGVLILLRAFTFLAADALTGSGHQKYRTSVQLLVAVMNVLMNLFTISHYGVAGAVVSTLACEFILAVVLWAYIGTHLKRTRRTARHRYSKAPEKRPVEVT